MDSTIPCMRLYMNGIIHPCTHPENRPPPTTEEEMFEEIFRYIDRLVYMIRPRKLVYLAVDGVAPRAKINQQRSRRFRAAKEAEEKQKELLRVRDEWKKKGLRVPEYDPNRKPFDSNVITPGTPFMTNLSVALKQFIADRVAHDPAYNKISVIYSDSSVPGEGEHKIAEFIRTQRAQEGYDPNTSHVLYGLDADLIMLALATHELNFYVLRERVFPSPQQSEQKRQPQEAQDSKIQDSSDIQNAAAIGARNSFQLLSIDILRECLEAEFMEPLEIGFEMESSSRHQRLEFDLERVIDDFVFLCFFVGNDFLPHLPSLDIREGAIDYLIELYKKLVPRFGYLSDDKGEIHFGRVRLFLNELATTEDYIFQKRKLEEEKKQKQQAERATENKQSENDRTKLSRTREDYENRKAEDDANLKETRDSLNFAVAESLKKRLKTQDSSEQASSNKQMDVANMEQSTSEQIVLNDVDVEEEEEEEEEELSQVEYMLELSDQQVKEQFEKELKERLYKKRVVDSVEDVVRLGEQGWKERYYEKKFHWSPQSETSQRKREELAYKYFEGLLWVMRYYYRGCVSWTWYFPYHYAPFASDLAACPFEADSVQYERGKPFRPLEQLMAVLPPSSAKEVLPKSLTQLMMDPHSELKPFYPDDFVIDLEGKRFVWQGVALLPFVDAFLLENAVRNAEESFTLEERERNSIGETILATHKSTLLGQFISQLSTPKDSSHRASAAAASEKIRGNLNLFGRLTRMDVASPTVIQAYYYLPAMKQEHLPRVLPNANYPLPQLEQRERYSIIDGQTGWKAAWFGPLGFLAKKMISYRLSKEDSWNRATRKSEIPSSVRNSFHSAGVNTQHYILEANMPINANPNHQQAIQNLSSTMGQQAYGVDAASFFINNHCTQTAIPFPIHPSVQKAQIEFFQQMQQSMKRNRPEENKNMSQKRAKR
ncbi:5'-3' exoribonuclease 2 [Galdieria sulphuraria]|nr:5'-3' exoribonuclease 2 [Galdieria sulphuraria]